MQWLPLSGIFTIVVFTKRFKSKTQNLTFHKYRFLYTGRLDVKSGMFSNIYKVASKLHLFVLMRLMDAQVIFQDFFNIDNSIYSFKF